MSVDTRYQLLPSSSPCLRLKAEVSKIPEVSRDVTASQALLKAFPYTFCDLLLTFESRRYLLMSESLNTGTSR